MTTHAEDIVDEDNLKSLLPSKLPQAPAARAAPRRRSAQKPRSASTALEQRRESERLATKRPIAEDDGRRLRAKGRTEQIGARVRPEVKEALANLQRVRNLTVTTILEEAILAQAAKYLTGGDT